MSQNGFSQTVSQSSVLGTNKLIKNTYLLLGATLVWSAIMAAVSMKVLPSANIGIFCSLGAFFILMFVMPRVVNSSSALIWVFAFTGLLGFGLGPVLAYYLAVNPSVVTSALSITAVAFFGLSGYALISKKNFNYLGGFLFSGLMVAFAAGIIGMIAAFVFNYPMPGLMLVVSGAFALLSCGVILYQTSQMVNGGVSNYVSATVTLYVSIYNIFTSLLHILGVMDE